MSKLKRAVSKACRSHYLVSTLTLVLGATSAQGQSPPAPPSNDRNAGAATLDEVVVTGTRLVRSGYDTPTPVTVLGAADFERRGVTNIADALNEVPAFRGSWTPQRTTLSTGNTGMNFLDLRGLGPSRTLVLMDGRRLVRAYTSSAQTAVNASLLPSIAVNRVEVVTGGASAVYGADAVAGVVNYVFDRRFEGGKVTLQGGTSSEGDNDDLLAAAMVGGGFAEGRGHATVAAEYHDNAGVPNQEDRAWGREGWGRYPNPLDRGVGDGVPAQISVPNRFLSNATFGGLITSPGPINGIQFGPGGTLQTFTPGTLVGPAYMSGGSGADTGAGRTLVPEVRRASFLATVDYDLTDRIRTKGDFLYGDTLGVIEQHPSWNYGGTALTIQSDNAFIPAALRPILATNRITSFRVGRWHRDLGYNTPNVSTKTYRMALGLEGEITDNWSWDVSYSYSDMAYLTVVKNLRIESNFNLALDAVVNPANGQIVCRASLNVNALPAPLRPLATNCVPINLFGEGSASREAIDYTHGNAVYDSKVNEHSAVAAVKGKLFDLPAGSLTVAFGAEYREEALDVKVDDISRNNGFQIANNQPLKGAQKVSELFGEVVVPLLQGVSGAEYLELNGAVRSTDYSLQDGRETTWKAGIVWSPIDSVRVRGTLSRDIRAPDLRELFAGQSQSTLSPVDPCDVARRTGNANRTATCNAAGLPADFRQTAGIIPVFTAGNPNLGLELADTATVGLVFSPEFLPGFRASIDWYRIEIDEAISLLAPQRLVDLCYSTQATLGSTCVAVTRGPTGQLVSLQRSQFNTANFETEGTDIEMSYSFTADLPFFPAGARISLRALASFMDAQRDSVDGVIFLERVGSLAGLPDFRGVFSANAEFDRLSVGAQYRYVGAMNQDNTFAAEDIDVLTVSSVGYLDLSARYKFGADLRTEIFGGLKNALDKDPPLAPSTSFITQPTDPNHFDVVGRAYYLGVRVKF